MLSMFSFTDREENKFSFVHGAHKRTLLLDSPSYEIYQSQISLSRSISNQKRVKAADSLCDITGWVRGNVNMKMNLAHNFAL